MSLLLRPLVVEHKVCCSNNFWVDLKPVGLRFNPARPFVFIYTRRLHRTALCCHIDNAWYVLHTVDSILLSMVVASLTWSRHVIIALMSCLQRKKTCFYTPQIQSRSPKVRVTNSSKNSTFQYTPIRPPPPRADGSFTYTSCQSNSYWSFTHTSCQPSPSGWSLCPYMSHRMSDWKHMVKDCVQESNGGRLFTQCNQILYTVYSMGNFFWEFWVNGSTVTEGTCTMSFGPVRGENLNKNQMCCRKNEK